MKILTAEEMRRADKRTAEAGIPTLILMENAGREVLLAAIRVFGPIDGRRIDIVAGRGNNGGDGLVIARHVPFCGGLSRVHLLGEAGDLSGDAAVNLRAARAAGVEILEVTDEGGMTRMKASLAASDLIIDAMLGTGTRKGPLRGRIGEAAAYLNALGTPVVSVDLPTGVDPDTGEVAGTAVRADLTVTLGAPKRGLFIHPGREFAGRVEVAPISIPPSTYADAGGDLLTRSDIGRLLPARHPTAHKGERRLLVAGGSGGMTGAAILASRAAMRSGAGLVFMAVPEGNIEIVSSVVEAVKRPLPGGKDFSGEISPAGDETYHAAVIGPGMGRGKGAARLLAALLDKLAGLPVLLDADALYHLAGDRGMIEGRGGIVLTPHMGEFARLAGRKPDEAGRIEAAADLAAETGCTVLLKGSPTIVASPGGGYTIVPFGGEVLATGGTGDVLSGIIGALLSAGLPPGDAAAAGAGLHGLASEIWIDERGPCGLTAGDLVDLIPRAWASLI